MKQVKVLLSWCYLFTNLYYYLSSVYFDVTFHDLYAILEQDFRSQINETTEDLAVATQHEVMEVECQAEDPIGIQIEADAKFDEDDKKTNDQSKEGMQI